MATGGIASGLYMLTLGVSDMEMTLLTTLIRTSDAKACRPVPYCIWDIVMGIFLLHIKVGCHMAWHSKVGLPKKSIIIYKHTSLLISTQTYIHALRHVYIILAYHCEEEIPWKHNNK